jgi:hypothetical protein
MNLFLNIFTTIVLCVSSVHPLHVSVTEIEFDEKDKALEITMRVFIDDAELTLRKNLNQPDLDVLNPKTGTTDQLLKDYILKHFAIALDNKAQKINYLGHEVDAEAFILYVEVANVKKWKTIQVKNDVLMELHEDQSNLINVTVKGNVRTLRLTNNSFVDKLIFDNK